MFKTHRYLATTALALGIVGATTACATTYGYRPGVVVYDRGQDRRAYDAGYRDGFDAGRSDAGHRERYDPVRSSRYRSADRDYDRRWGPRDEYARAYRAAFERGYAEGYRAWRR